MICVPLMFGMCFFHGATFTNLRLFRYYVE